MPALPPLPRGLAGRVREGGQGGWRAGGAGTTLHRKRSTTIPALIDSLLFAFLVATTVIMIRLRDLFATVMLAGIYSLLSAGLYTVMDAVDVAFTEAAVGAGISTVLFVATLAFTRRTEKRSRRGLRLLPLLVVLTAGGALIYGTLDMPGYGDPGAPIHHHVAPRYVTSSPAEVGPPNMVTSILASYRGYDTFGETTVIFTAAIGVLLLFTERRGRRLPAPPPDDGEEEEEAP